MKCIGGCVLVGIPGSQLEPPAIKIWPRPPRLRVIRETPAFDSVCLVALCPNYSLCVRYDTSESSVSLKTGPHSPPLLSLPQERQTSCWHPLHRRHCSAAMPVGRYISNMCVCYSTLSYTCTVFSKPPHVTLPVILSSTLHHAHIK